MQTHAQLPKLHFLNFDADVSMRPLEGVAWRGGGEEAETVESAMASLADGPNGGKGRLRIAMVDRLDGGRTIYSAREKFLGKGTLADVLSRLDGRMFSPDDVIFLLPDGALGTGSSHVEGALHLAIHNVAFLVAAGAPKGSRDTLYLSAALLVLAAVGLPEAVHSRMVDDFLRMWLRDHLTPGGDPPLWSLGSLERMKSFDPIKATFMQGIGDSIVALAGLVIPAPLSDIAETARRIQAYATLASAETMGSS